MTIVEFAALFVVLCFNAYNLNEIRKISRACYVELNTTRWETGMRSAATQNQQEGFSPLRRQA